MARLTLFTSLLLVGFLVTPAFAHEEHHPTAANEPPVNYSDWKNRKDEGCCNNQDCAPLAETEVQEEPSFKVRIEDKWCPVQPWHFLKTGNAPDWGKNHACIRKFSSSSETGQSTPHDPCARLLCFQPRPGI